MYWLDFITLTWGTTPLEPHYHVPCAALCRKLTSFLLVVCSMCLLQVFHLLLPVSNVEARDHPVQQLLELTGWGRGGLTVSCTGFCLMRVTVPPRHCQWPGLWLWWARPRRPFCTSLQAPTDLCCSTPWINREINMASGPPGAQKFPKETAADTRPDHLAPPAPLGFSWWGQIFV